MAVTKGSTSGKRSASTKTDTAAASAKADMQKRDEALAAPAEIPPATEMSQSGAPRQTSEIDVDHPAIDNDPRAGTTVLQNRADMNDPNEEASDAVARQLNEQGVPTKSAE